MKKIVVTLTHRLENIQFFSNLLDSNLDAFDEWHVWANTNDITMLNTILDLIKSRKGKIITPIGSDPGAKLANVPRFWKDDSTNNESVYIKLDDDIVWMEPNFINKLFTFKINHPEYFIVSANVINNAVISFLHERTGHITLNSTNKIINKLLCTDNFLCPTGWSNPVFAEELHRQFLYDLKNHNFTKWYLSNWLLDLKQIVSINAISWMGSDMNKFLESMNMGENDEFFIMNFGSIRLNKHNIIYGEALCSHYAFHTQKPYLDTTDILSEYRNLGVSI